MMRDVLIQRIQDALSPDLIDLKWQGQANEKPLHGYCYVASEALYHMWGKAHGYKPAQLYVHVGNGTRYSHWFLRRDDDVLDITAAQFGRTRIHYHLARNCGFLTGDKPSNAAQEIMRRIGHDPAVLADYRDARRQA